MPTSTAPQCPILSLQNLYIESFRSFELFFVARLPRMVKMQTLDLEGNQIGEYLGQSSVRMLRYQVISTPAKNYDFL